MTSTTTTSNILPDILSTYTDIIKTCSICFGEIAKTYRCKSCNLLFCGSCIIAYFTETKFIFNCPNCHFIWPIRQSEFVLTNSFKIKLNKIVKNSLYEKYKEKIESFRNNLDNYKFYKDFDAKVLEIKAQQKNLRKLKKDVLEEIKNDPKLSSIREELRKLRNQHGIVDMMVLDNNTKSSLFRLDNFVRNNSSKAWYPDLMTKAYTLRTEWNLVQSSKHYEERHKNLNHEILMLSRSENSESYAVLHEKYISLSKSFDVNSKSNVNVKYCSDPTCNGIIKDMFCEKCKKKICQHCNNLFQNEIDHECKKEDVLSAEMIKKDSKKCPNCEVLIARISGCDHMWCTNCNTAFDWKTGSKILKKIQNPHYSEWVEKNKQKEMIDICILTSKQLKDIKVLTENCPTFITLIMETINLSRTFIPTIISEHDFFKSWKNTECIYKFLNEEIDKKTFVKKFTTLMSAHEYRLEVEKIILAFIETCEDIVTTILLKKEDFIRNKSDIIKLFLARKKDFNNKLRILSEEAKSSNKIRIKKGAHYYYEFISEHINKN